MNRRNFTKKMLAAGSFLALQHRYMQSKAAKVKPKHDTSKILNAYYFRAHTYTMVPKQIREDLDWMAAHGTDVVSVAVLEQDLFAAVENIAFICNEAEKRNMSVFAVPSRWGGIVAGAPKVPSIFTCQNPQTWVLNKNGSVRKSGVSGCISSIHSPETLDFITTTVEKMLKLWNLKGIIWDEPKTLSLDYSPQALKKLGKTPTIAQQAAANADFYSTVNKFTKEISKDVITNLFLYASLSTPLIEQCALIKHLDYFGCDGRPWYNEDGGKQEGKGKVLLGNDGGERFLKIAKQNKLNSLWLVENHNMASADIPKLKKRLPEVIVKKPDHLIYYYYPRNLEKPEEIMQLIGKHIKNFR